MNFNLRLEKWHGLDPNQKASIGYTMNQLMNSIGRLISLQLMVFKDENFQSLDYELPGFFIVPLLIQLSNNAFFSECERVILGLNK